MKIKVVLNGPIILDTSEPVAVSTGAASESKPGPIYLCRCGQSANKPFCDGSHARTGFQSVCEARELPPPKPRV